MSFSEMRPGHSLEPPVRDLRSLLIQPFRRWPTAQIAGARAMQNPELRRAAAEAGVRSIQDSAAARERSAAYWSNPENRRRHSELKKQHCADPRIRERMEAGFRRSTQGRDGGGMTVSERRVFDQLVNEGWEVLRGGWPDFLALHPDGRRQCVEVKSPRDSVRKNQQRMHDVLRGLGLEVVVLRASNDGAPPVERVTSKPLPRVRALRIVKPLRARRSTRAFSDDRLRELSHLSTAEAACALEVTTRTVAVHRKRLGIVVTPEQKGPSPRELDLTTVDGLSCREAAQRLGVSEKLIQERRRQAGYPSAVGNGHVASRYPAGKAPRKEAA